jgi:hypothetical protein
MTGDQWYYRLGGRPHGPFTPTQFQKLVRGGTGDGGVARRPDVEALPRRPVGRPVGSRRPAVRFDAGPDPVRGSGRFSGGGEGWAEGPVVTRPAGNAPPPHYHERVGTAPCACSSVGRASGF